MKIAFRVPIAEVESMYITMENQNWAVRAIPQLCRTLPVVTADATYAYCYLNIDKLVQGAGSSGGASSNFQVLDGNSVETFQNLQNVTIAKFEKGMTYFIPVGTFAPLQMIPDVWFTTIAAGTPTTNEILTASHFRYDCAEDTDILNGTQISGCVSCQVIGQNMAVLDQRKDDRKTAEVLSFNAAVGNPVAVQAINQIAANTGKSGGGLFGGASQQ